MNVPRALARPPEMRGVPYAHLALFVVAVVVLRVVLVSGLAAENRYNLWLFYGILVVGFYFVFGMAGQFAFSQAAMAAVGGYASSWLMREGSGFLVAFVFGIGVAAVIALAFALLVRKATLFYLAIASLALSFIVLQIIDVWDKVTGFVDVQGGQLVGVEPIELFGWKANTSDRIFAVLLGALAIVLLMGIWLARSPVKRESYALRDQAVVATTLGVPTMRLRIWMFVFGSAIGAAGGSLFVHWKGFAAGEDFALDLALGIFVMLIVGGIDSLWGPIIGAAFYVFVPHWLTEWLSGFDEYQQIFYGAVLLLVMIVFPEGLVGLFQRLRGWLMHVPMLRGRRTWLTDFLGLTRGGGEAPVSPSDAAPLPPLTEVARHAASARGGALPDGAILRATDVAVSFGGVRAVDGVSLDVGEHEILGLVGPNGSGKSTFLNAIVGVVPAGGRVEVAGLPVPLGRPGRARELGVLRTYQTPQTYTHLSCIEDVLLSTPDRALTGLTSAFLARPWMMQRERARWARAADALARVGLLHLAEQPAARLSYGQRRLLELARGIAGAPRVLLLDEPSAGLDASETEQLAGYLRQLRDDGVALLVVDHKLDFITSLCERVAVLELGRLVAVGAADEVFRDQRVVDAYLGVAEID